MQPILPARLKVLAKRLLATVGVREDVGLLPVAAVIGLLTSIAAVAFHELIEFLKRVLYEARGEWLYEHGLWLLIVLPAAGGLVVGIISKVLIRGEGGHGVVDVIESVIRTRGFQKPITAIEKILTSAITIGTGGSCGAEGPIIQIGAAVSSFVGQVIGIGRHRMPLLVGCGTAAGISAIFNCPIGGVLFTLEVILRDFSVRTLVPVVVASIVGNVATHWIFERLNHGRGYTAIFGVPPEMIRPEFATTLSLAMQFVLLGVICGVVGVGLTKSMLLSERLFAPLKRFGAFRPAIGGAIVGLMGVGFVVFFGWVLQLPKPFPFHIYPMPAFLGDGYGVIRTMLDGSFASLISPRAILGMVLGLLVLKIAATSITLGSGGSGGVIAPALFLGAASGELLGTVMPMLGASPSHAPMFAIIGMGACLGAVVHAPLASILILFELTLSPGVMVPAMLTTVTAHGVARSLMADSIYTLSLRHRGIFTEAAQDMSVLRKYTIDHLPLEPLIPLLTSDPIQRAIDLAGDMDRSDFIVTDAKGTYRGILTTDELQQVLIDNAAIPLLTVGEVMRSDVKPMRHTENLASLFDAFVKYEVHAMPIGLEYDPTKTIGLVTRDALLRHTQKHWLGR